MKIDEIRYDGEYPCLCHGSLVVVIDGKEYDFGKYAFLPQDRVDLQIRLMKILI